MDTGVLAGGAAEGSLLEGDLLGARGMIDAAGSGASAAGDPGAVGAVSEVCTVWSGSLGALGEAIGQLHRNLGAGWPATATPG